VSLALAGASALAVSGCSGGHGSPGAAAHPQDCGAGGTYVAHPKAPASPGCYPAPAKKAAASPAAIQTSAPASSPTEPVSTLVCQKFEAAWTPYSETGGNVNPTAADELAIGHRVWNLAQRIPGNEVYVGTSQTPGPKVALDVWSQEVQTLGHGGTASGSTIQETAQTVENDCATLGVSNVLGLSS
jgi:hypothetical protein